MGIVSLGDYFSSSLRPWEQHEVFFQRLDLHRQRAWLASQQAKNLHLCMAPEQVGEHALVSRIQMLNHDKSHTRIGIVENREKIFRTRSPPVDVPIN
jgi:hypothetical protein